MCIRWIENDKEYLKICVLRKMRDVILCQVHDSQCEGHMGIRGTYLRSGEVNWLIKYKKRLPLRCIHHFNRI